MNKTHMAQSVCLFLFEMLLRTAYGGDLNRVMPLCKPISVYIRGGAIHRY